MSRCYNDTGTINILKWGHVIELFDRVQDGKTKNAIISAGIETVSQRARVGGERFADHQRLLDRTLFYKYIIFRSLG